MMARKRAISAQSACFSDSQSRPQITCIIRLLIADRAGEDSANLAQLVIVEAAVTGSCGGRFSFRAFRGLLRRVGGTHVFSLEEGKCGLCDAVTHNDAPNGRFIVSVAYGARICCVCLSERASL
jgi:hypothetical protein